MANMLFASLNSCCCCCEPRYQPQVFEYDLSLCMEFSSTWLLLSEQHGLLKSFV
jgi:hypothetical protein